MKKRKFQIIILISCVILLVFVLFAILNFSKVLKSESKNLMEKFDEYFSSKELKIVYYYSSVDTDDNKAIYELEYLLNLKKEYDIDYLDIDKSKLNNKNINKIENSLGIEGTYPTTVVVKNSQVVAVQEGFIESHKLVNFLIEANVLDKTSKYKDVDNLKFINYDDYKKILKSEKINIVVVGKAGCEYCMSAKPILNNISKAYKVKVNYLDLTDMNTNDLNDFSENLKKLEFDSETFLENESLNLPTILIIKKGKIVSYLEGLKSLEEYIDYLKENEAIE